MNHDFLIGAAQLNQAFESQVSGGSGNEITRRSFIKRTGAATVATFVTWNLQTGNSRAEESAEDADASYRWILRCVADPGESTSEEWPDVILPTLAEAGTATFGPAAAAQVAAPTYKFNSIKDTGFDPPGPGDGTNCKLFTFLRANGPTKGQEGTQMEVTATVESLVVIRSFLRAWIGEAANNPEGDKPGSIPGAAIETDIKPLKVTAKIDNKGKVTYTPEDGNRTGNDSCQWSCGYSDLSFTNKASFTASATMTHAFNSAYSGSVSAEAKTKFLEIFDVGFSASLAIDLNNLGTIHCNPDDLEWTLKRVKQKLKKGKVISEEVFDVEDAPEQNPS